MQRSRPSRLSVIAGGKTTLLRRASSPQFALVIPTLREAGNIRLLLARVRAALDRCGVAYEVIVVDDDSRDGIERIVSEIAARDPRVRLVVRRGEHGLAGAVLRGWAATDAPLLGVMDADLQHPPELLPRLWAALGAGADLVVGSRYACGGSLQGWKPARHLISRLAVWMTRPVQRCGLRARDPMSGFFLVRRSCVEGIAFQPSGFKILLEILARAEIRSAVEIPFDFGRRHAGRSKAGLRVALDYLLLLVRLYGHSVRPPRAIPESVPAALERTEEAVSG
jgi:dolichol-phosphate mannosyltransferase